MKYIFFLVLALYCVSCQPSFICDQTASQSFLQINFLTQACNNTTIPSTINTLADSSYYQHFTRVYAIVHNRDSSNLILDTAGRSNLSLPLSNIDDSLAYVFEINKSPGALQPNLVRDTLQIGYTRKLQYISQGCGYAYNYTLKQPSIKFTSHYFAFLNTVNLSLSPSIASNIKIYNITNLQVPRKCRIR